MTPTEELTHLRDLVQSEGWKLYLRHVADAWGHEAFERALDAALQDCPVDEERAMTSRLRDTFKGVRADSQWPQERIRAIEGGETKAESVVGSALYRRFRNRLSA